MRKTYLFSIYFRIIVALLFLIIFLFLTFWVYSKIPIIKQNFKQLLIQNLNKNLPYDSYFTNTDVQLLPPGIIIDNVKLKIKKNAYSTNNISFPQIISIDQLKVTVDLIALLKGQFKIDKFLINHPQIRFQQNQTATSDNNFSLDVHNLFTLLKYFEGVQLQIKDGFVEIQWNKPEIVIKFNQINGILEYSQDRLNLWLKNATSIQGPNYEITNIQSDTEITVTPTRIYVDQFKVNDPSFQLKLNGQIPLPFLNLNQFIAKFDVHFLFHQTELSIQHWIEQWNIKPTGFIDFQSQFDIKNGQITIKFILIL